MKKAGYTEKNLVVRIFSKSFNDNKSVNYLLPQDGNSDRPLRKFMEYSFEVCYHFGDVFLSDDRKGCALILLPDKKKGPSNPNYST